MTGEEWDTIATMLEEWWPGDFPDTTAEAWRIGLGTLPFDTVGNAVLAVAHQQAARGEKFRPSMPEVLAQVTADPSRPTVDEVAQILWAKGGVMHVRAAYPDGGWASIERSRAADDQAVLTAAAAHHPLIGAFLTRQTVQAVRTGMDVRDLEHGGPNRNRLTQAWTAFLDSVDRRGVAAVTGAGRQLGRLDPLAGLGDHIPTLQAIDGGR